ncbi:hypothetical protein [Paraburkholderia youngii]|uniref:hypothetical protein n=1 Tax=Paraburkholderia youngii TaxID=2782701 RepID=UPI001FE780ED|nr:hypothetical protein [Paraburkholderia youngii]
MLQVDLLAQRMPEQIAFAHHCLRTHPDLDRICRKLPIKCQVPANASTTFRFKLLPQKALRIVQVRLRRLEELGKKHLRGQRSVQEKERAKWLEGIEQLGILKTHCPHTQVIGVSDREGDVYDVFLARRPAGVDWLVRASWNRHVAHPDRYLLETVLALPVIGETQLQVPARKPTGAHRTAGCTMHARTPSSAAKSSSREASRN